MTGRALAGVGLLAAGLAVGGYFALRARARQAGERLVQRAVELGARNHERPSHAPEPGSVGERLAALPKRAPGADWTERCTAVARGEEPLEQLPPACEAAWQRDRAWAAEVMRAARAERWSPLPDDKLQSVVYAGRLAALEARKLPQGEAGELCADALALARDRSLGAGALGTMVGASLVHEVAGPCTVHLAGRRQAVELIVGTWPKANDWVPYEALSLMGAFYPALSDEQLQRIPPRLRSEAPQSSTFLEDVALMQALPGVVTLFERVEQAGGLEPGARDAQLNALQAEERESWNPIRRVAAPDYTRFFARGDRCRHELEALLGR